MRAANSTYLKAQQQRAVQLRLQLGVGCLPCGLPENKALQVDVASALVVIGQERPPYVKPCPVKEQRGLVLLGHMVEDESELRYGNLVPAQAVLEGDRAGDRKGGVTERRVLVPGCSCRVSETGEQRGREER